MLADPNKWCKEHLKPVWKRVVQQAACFFLILLVGWDRHGNQPTVRAAVINFVKEVFQNQEIYRYTGISNDEKKPELTDFEITNLPDSYIIEDIQDAAGFTVIYNLPNAEDGKAAIVFIMDTWKMVLCWFSIVEMTHLM